MLTSIQLVSRSLFGSLVKSTVEKECKFMKFLSSDHATFGEYLCRRRQRVERKAKIDDDNDSRPTSHTCNNTEEEE